MTSLPLRQEVETFFRQHSSLALGSCCRCRYVTENNKKPDSEIRIGLFCGNDWNRTNDTSIFSAVLYQLSYITSSWFPAGLIGRWGAQK